MPEEEEEEEFEEEMDMFEALGSLLATEEGETVATALVSIKEATEKIAASFETQNKILVKILSELKPKTPGPEVTENAA
jgi:hypothetical protein